MDRQQEFVLRTIEERDIRFVRLWFTDVLGTLKSVAVAPAELEGAFAEGIGFDGSAIEGFARVYEADMLAKPDPSTFQVLPWRGDNPGTARMFCDITLPDGSPSLADPRYVLKRALAKAADLGLHLLHPPRDRVLPARAGLRARASRRCRWTRRGYFDHVPHGTAHDFRRAAITMLESMGISVEFSHHEGGPGQNEIDLRYADALTTADNIMTFRTVIKEVALEQGVFASFMPKPFAEHPGSGMHTHLSLFEGDRNAFHEAGAPLPAEQGRAGSSSPACCGTPPRSPRSPTSGSTPTSGSGAAARRRRTSAGGTTTARRWSGCRCTSRARASRTRVEVRSLDSACNPYLAFARDARRRAQGHRGGLRAARRGRGRRLEPDRRRAPGDGHRAAADHPVEAIRVMEESELVAETLGEHVFDFFLRNKRAEWEDYRSAGHAVRAGALPAGAVTPCRPR